MSSYPRAIVPAFPGWYLAEFFVRPIDPGDDTPAFVDLHPIIAWYVDVEAIDRDEEVAPITRAGLWRSRRPKRERTTWGFKRPDGKYEVDGDIYDTEADVLGVLKRLNAA
jgi:hypothetical protein